MRSKSAKPKNINRGFDLPKDIEIEKEEEKQADQEIDDSNNEELRDLKQEKDEAEVETP